MAGIVNADCMLVAHDSVMSAILQSARKGLVLTERLNIGADDLRATGTSCSGFDFFLFSRSILDDFSLDLDIAIGTPWCDYWLPLAWHLAGGQLFTVPAPVLMHLDHPQNWSQDSWIAHGREVYRFLAASREGNGLFPAPLYQQPNEVSERDLGAFGTAVFQWLRESPSIEIEDPFARLWCSVLAGIDSASKQARDAERSLEEAERRLKESLCWKMMGPLRGIGKALSGVRTWLLSIFKPRTF